MLGLDLFKKILVLYLFHIPLSVQAWTNWAQNQTCNPTQILHPKTIADLKKCVKESSLSNHKMRVVGAGYSYSDCACTDGVMLDMHHLNNILAYDLDRKTVTVETGITLKELNNELSSSNLALSNVPASDAITLGGALASGVHGSGHTGTLSSFIKEMDILTATGGKITVSSKDQSLFNAALVSLGALGVVYSVTLQCEPLFYLNDSEEIMELDWFLEHYKDLHDQHDFLQCTWDVKAKNVRVHSWDRCIKQDSLCNAKTCYETLCWYTVRDDDKDLTAEIAIPFNNLPQAIKQLIPLIEQFWTERVEIFHEVGIRFVLSDHNASLSPAFDKDVAYINISAPQSDKGLQFCKRFEEVMMNHQGRPHWGKINFLDYDKALKLYDQNLINFIDIKNKLDPRGLFSNAFIDRICKKNYAFNT